MPIDYVHVLFIYKVKYTLYLHVHYACLGFRDFVKQLKANI